MSSLRGRALRVLFGDDAGAAEKVLRERCAADFEALTVRAAAGLAGLPHVSLEAAREAAETALARRQLNGVVPGEGRVKALELLREQPMVALQDVADYSRGVWARLNGRAPRSQLPAALAGLPLQQLSRAAREGRLVTRAIEVEQADFALMEAARAREAQLRRRDPMGLPAARALRDLDAAVRDARAVLAVRSLALEAERVYGALEEEAMDVSEAGAPRDAELAVLVAEFGALDSALAAAAAAVARGEAVLVEDDALDAMAADSADLRARLGIAEDGAGAKDLTLGMLAEKVARSARDAGSKVTDGAAFLSRGLRLLGEDVSGAFSLFLRTLSGGTLMPREVQALRRTSRDLLTFIPFIILLIAPITPVGHVMAFSFLQRYFPGFFPSQFTSRRQELFRRFEELRRELQAAEESAVAATEAAALQRASSIVARLTRGEATDGFTDLFTDVSSVDVEQLQAQADEVAVAVLTAGAEPDEAKSDTVGH